MYRKLYSIVHAHSFEATLARLGSPIRTDEACEGLLWIIARSPELFPIVPGFDRLRVARTDRTETAHGMMPPLRIYFVIRNENEVELLAAIIESDDPDRVGEPPAPPL